MILIIAEKPSLARNIAGAIGNMKKQGAWFSGNGYLVTWAFGHLFSLCDIEDYTNAQPGSRWTPEGLPFFPPEFRYKLKTGADKQPDAGALRQFGVIRDLCERADVDTVVNAGDADREGEIIVRQAIAHTGGRDKPCLRLWLPDQTDETILAALKEMKSDAEYDRLADEGFARTYIDWLYGVNLTRFATLKTGTLLRVGRVIVPIVKAIYDRDMAIRNFQPETYIALVSEAETNGVPVRLTSKYQFSVRSPQRAALACQKLLGAGAVVTQASTKKETLNPGKLYSLSKLQNYLGKKYKMPMDESLALTQKLYEAGYLTYPRTNSEYLATAEKDKVKRVLEKVAGMGYPVAFTDKKSVFDDSKIESHSALTPTTKLPAPNKLSEREKLVYSAVLRRFVAVFCSQPCVAKKTELTVAVGDYETFTLKGTVILEPGWTKFDDPKTDKLLPDVKKGDRINIDFQPKEKQTSPPRHYTIETLNNYLKNPFRDEKKQAQTEDDAEEYRAVFEGLELGTEATRTGIIENALKSKYIALNKDVYTLLPGGEFLIESLSRMHISMDKYKTGTLGKALKQVYRGEIGVADAVKLAEDEIRQVFGDAANDPENERFGGYYGDAVGVCPLCGGKVKRGRYRYDCEHRTSGCVFSIPQNLCGRDISLKEASQLLADGKTPKLEGFISKRGAPFSAALALIDGKTEFVFEH